MPPVDRGERRIPPSRIARRALLLAVVLLLALGASFVVAPSSSADAVDEVHYTFTGPTSVGFDWRGTPNDIRYGPTPDYGTTVLASTPDPLPFSSAGPFWEARLTGLAPGAAYHYSIGGGPDHMFHAAPTAGFRFDVIADVSSSLSSSRVVITQSQIAADDPSFVLVSGDLTYANAEGQAAADQHFNDVMAWSQTAAYMPAWGNHEWDTPDDLRNYKGRFALPDPQASPGAPALGCCGEDWGWFDAGGVRFIAYPEPFTGAWSDWKTKAGQLMAAAQADPSIDFIVTYGHRPAYSTGNHPGSTNLAGILNGLGDTYSKYVLNLNGHSHDYERFQPIHGVVHITAAGGGANLETPWTRTDPRTAFRAMHLEHLRVDVSTTSLHIEAVCGPPSPLDDITCTQGAVIDSLDITSRPSGDVAPIAGLSVMPSSGQTPLLVTADSSASSDTDQTPIQSYTFSFGDGSSVIGPQAGATAQHTYQVSGTYMVTVTVTDTAGFSATASAQVSATQGADAPVAFLSVTPTSGAIPLEVIADASSSADNDATPIQTYAFDFGDGSPSVGPQPGATATHTYSVAGTYTVTVTVTDTGGLSSTTTTGVRASGNLIGNPGFESDAAGWNATPATVSVSRVVGGHSSDWGAQVTNMGTTTVSCALNDSPNWVARTVAGTYRGTAWLWSDRIGAPIQLRLKEYVGSTLVHTQLARGKLNGGWQQLSITYTVTAPGSTLDFNVVAPKAPPGTCFLADDLAITFG